MVDEVDCLWSLISLLVKFFLVVRKAISIALRSNSLHPSWKSIAEMPKLAQNSKEVSNGSMGSVLLSNGYLQENSSSRILPESTAKPSALRMDECPKYHPKVSLSMPTAYDAMQERLDKGLDTSSTALVGKEKMPSKVRKRPASIAIPESCVDSWLIEASKERDMIEEVEVEASEYCLAGRKGSRHVMEDGYGVMTNINGESKQAFFGVFDGHGGRAAVDFVSEKLGKNIIMALDELVEEDQLELAIKAGYLTTDKEFLTQGVSSGACAATALLKNGELHVSNVGDCRVVLSRKGVASALTRDHHAGREDERIRIANSGGFVSRRNGVWRIQDSLAVSRAFGDVNLKEWIISEPETNKVCLTPDCDFLIMASDGLWDKVSNQEAVDIVSRHKCFIQSCKELVSISYSRGSRDDITVMVVDLQRYVKLG